MSRDAPVSGRIAIPEIDEGLGQIGYGWASNAQMRIAPDGRVEAPQVIPTNDTGSTMHDEQLAMIQGVAPEVEQLPGTAYRLVGQRMNGRWKHLERVWYHGIAKAVEDHVGLHALGGFACQVLLERLTNSIVLPDVGFQVNALLGRIDSGEHGIVEVAPIIIDLQAILPDVYFTQIRVGETPPLPMSLASR